MKKLVKFILKTVGILACIYAITLAIIVVLVGIYCWHNDRTFMQECTEEYNQKMPEEAAIKHCKEILVEIRAID